MLRSYDPARDRVHAHDVLRDLLVTEPYAYHPHPGDWDWWTFHADPRYRYVQLVGDHAVVMVSVDDHDVAAFGLLAEDAIAIGREHFGDERFTISGVALADVARVDVLERAGFTIDGTPWPGFEQPTASVERVAAEGYEIRRLAGEDEHVARADAARLAFRSTLDPDAHRARYLRFMRSPAYEWAQDIVAVAPDGTVAAFAVHWPDDVTSTAQYEPVGTHPDHQRKGLARALLADGIVRMRESGIALARVMTTGDNHGAIATYRNAGFQTVAEVATFRSR